MSANTIDAKLFRAMFLAGAKNLEAKKEYINELNVFPVPDGDTGTNMTLTIMSAAKEVAALPEDAGLKEISKAISSGSLRGARGNSGVILSQLFRGMCKVIGGLENNVITVEDLIAAFDKAVESAYKAVMKPKEGTILTVAKGVYEKAAEFDSDAQMDAFIDACIVYAQEVLDKTPEMLPVLKQAGVVDSGGQGLLEVLKGAQKIFRGEELDLTIEAAAPVVKKTSIDSSEVDTADIKFGYCTEFIIMLSKTFNIKHEMDFKSFLESIGDSIVVVADDDIVKVHVHTNDPGLAIQRALTYGQLSNMKIDNMRLEHQEKLFKEAEKNEEAAKAEPVELKDFGFISVSVGDGLDSIFKDLGVDQIISGGQTMNPSTDDILSAIEALPAKTIYVFPNNKNIIMAANQARDLTEDKEIIVVPTKTVPQGISAIINFMPDLSGEENLQNMMETIENVMTGQVTYAVRDTEIDNKVIKENDIMGIGDKTILAVGTEIAATTIEMVDEMMKDAEDAELISIYYGSDVTEEDAQALASAIEEKYDDCDVELQYGGQPIYYYVLSVE